MDSPLISVRVVNVDWYLSEENRLPVVRIFGPTPAGQRACLHLHGALPYFMVRPMEDENPAICTQFESPGNLDALLPQLEQAIETAMASSTGRTGTSPQSQGKSSGTGTGQRAGAWRPRRGVLARLEVVRGVPFYGYHGEEKLFVKVYVNNPALTGKVASVLQAGHVLSTRFQPYESHVPFLLQVYIDYNISGMSYVHMKNALFLQPLPEQSSVPPACQSIQGKTYSVQNASTSSGVFTSATIPESLVARPPEERAVVPESMASVSAGKEGSSRATEEAEKQTRGRKDQLSNLPDDADEAVQDLLAGISMSQILSQPLASSPDAPRFRHHQKATPKATSTPGKPSLASLKASTFETVDAQKGPALKWWERQTTTELEITGTVDDVINPSLLVTGGAEEAGGKPMAVASLRELWDEEKERSRMAGGGSQLSAPPGLELADSQDTWEPPEGLLTQDMRGAVDDLALNVLRRLPAAAVEEVEANTSHHQSWQPRSQASNNDMSEQPLSPQVELTPSSRDGLSQISADVAGVSSSPANYLPTTLSARGNSDVDQGLLDMLAALRGSQSPRNEDDPELSSPVGGTYSQSVGSGPLSQEYVLTPSSSKDQADTAAATQKKQELEEEALEKHIALAAASEHHYDSDGSDDYHETINGRITAANLTTIFEATSTPLAACATSGAVSQTPVAGSPLWSQRAASYPPWSQRKAGEVAVRAATLPSWSQRSTEAGSLRLSGVLALKTRSYRCEENKEEQEEGEGEGCGIDDMMSQLSSRGLEDLENSVRANLGREGNVSTEVGSSPYETLFRAQPFQSFEPSELVGIMSSQVEVEQDQDQGHSTTVVRDGGMTVIQEDGGRDDDEEEEKDDAHEDECEQIMRETQQNEGTSGEHRWTRGPIRLRYDDTEGDEDEDHLQGSPENVVGRSQQQEGADEVGAGVEDKSGGESSLRLRGGVGLSRTKGKPPRLSRSATVPETQRDFSATSEKSYPVGDGVDPAILSTGNKRSSPSEIATQQEAPGAPGGLRRSTSMPGGKFKPPSLFATSKFAGGAGDADRAGVETAATADRSFDSVSGKMLEKVGGVSDDDDPGDGGSCDGLQADGGNSGEEERSQVVVPGWGSQGYHPVEYLESQLSFVTTAQLRTSPTLAHGRVRRVGGEATASEKDAHSKRHKLAGGKYRSYSMGACSPTVPKEKTESGSGSDRGCAGGTAGLILDVELACGKPEPSQPNTTTPFAETSNFDVSHVKKDAQVTSLAIGAELDQEPAPVDVEWREPENSTTAEEDVQSRWKSADARLRLAQARDSSLPFNQRSQADSGSCVQKMKTVSELISHESPDTHRVTEKTPKKKLLQETPSDCTVLQESIVASAAPLSGLGKSHGLVGASSNSWQQGLSGEPRCLPSPLGFVVKKNWASLRSPATAGAVSATPTPPSPPALDWERSPAPPLSGHSDQSDMPPLGQRSPAQPITMNDGPSAWTSSTRRQGGRIRVGEKSPRVQLTPRGDSIGGSPTSEKLTSSCFTPPTAQPRRSSSMLHTVELRPREVAPDPKMSAAALKWLGVPQVLHTEPFYSRKSDVPERPREFAGKVFRIPHKDDLQAFDTLPSRELFHAFKRAEAARSTTYRAKEANAVKNSSGYREYDNSALSPSSCTPQSPAIPEHASWKTQSSWKSQASGASCSSGEGGDLSTTPQPQEHISGGVAERCAATTPASGLGGRRREVGGSSDDGLGRKDGDNGRRQEQQPAPMRGIDEWKELTTATSGARKRGRYPRRRVNVNLVPFISPPSYKVVAAWGRANPNTFSRRSRSSLADVEAPVLRSTKNALGVLAGGGEADLADRDSAEMSMVADPNTGKLVPDTPMPPPTPAPIRRQGCDGGNLETLHNTPPLQTSESAYCGRGTPNCSDHITPDTRTMNAKRPTQEPHRPTTKSQISPTTQTPSSCLSGEDGNGETMGKFAFGLAARRRTNIAAADSGGSQGIGGGGAGRIGGDRLTVLSLEIHVQVGGRGSRKPDPRQDSVHAVCWRVKDSFTSAERETVETSSGVIVLPLATARRMAMIATDEGAKGNNEGGGCIGISGSNRGIKEVCLKCGKNRNDDERTFCTFEGGGFLRQGGTTDEEGAVGGRGTFCHGLGKGVEVLEVCSEAQVMRELVRVFSRHDPDFVVGWEVQGDSLGYLVERGLNMDPSVNMTRLLSRTPGRVADQRNTRDEWGKTHGSGIWLAGRTVLNMWRLMRSELKLCSYTLQSVAEHVLRKRIPSFSVQLRSRWFSNRNVATRSRALAEPLGRATACLSIMDKLDLLGRTSEMARLFGIDFFSVLSRGSQYRVEAVMLRVLKPRNFVAVSPSRQQVASQAAMESIPLVFEPRSRLYTSPVVVLDFQSLYPSMMIAYNLCYSTALGKFDPKTGGTSGNLGVLPYPETRTSAALAQASGAHQAWQQYKHKRKHHGYSSPSPFISRNVDRQAPGTRDMTPNPATISKQAAQQKTPTPLSAGERKGESTQGFSRSSPNEGGEFLPLPFYDEGGGGGEGGGMKGWDPRSIHVAPNTAGFCHPSLRQGILPLMLREILETRVMIKGAMRRAEEAGQRVLARTLNARQFALKMISNVTYGYTAAGFSGRMPMAELADAIVESGRQTLIGAARTVDSHKTWEASVVYGDTDSLFIELPGRSLEEAHRIGKEMAATISKSCPPDVVLKFEKVYLPCILASKKRYVGHMYESPKDLKPSFDAKGIETVRRDGCPLLVKMLEKVLRLLFTTKDLSQVKGYLYRQWTRILTDRAAVGDFVFAKEVRLGTYASDVYMPPSAIVASKAMASDPRAEPKYCERVPYVVVAGPVGARLMDLVVSPEQLLAEGSGLRLNGKYYITKVVNPALGRALALVGVDVNSWYNDMPRPTPRVLPKAASAANGAVSMFRGGGLGGSGGWGSGRGSGSGGSGGYIAGGGKGKGRGQGGRGGRRACVITSFFISDRCLLCGEQCSRSVCGKCAREPAANYAALARLRESELASQQLLELCRQCTGHHPPELFGLDSCGSLECPVFFERHRATLRSQEARELCDALGLLSS